MSDEYGLALEALPECPCGKPAEVALVNRWKSTLGGHPHDLSGTWGQYCRECGTEALQKARAEQQHPNVAKALKVGE